MKRHFDDWDLHLRFWPSIEEIQDGPLDRYYGGLDGFYRSLKDLEHSLRTSSSKIRISSVPKTNPAFAPELLADIALSVGTAGAATVLYKLLKIWVELKNGRKIKVVVGDFEIETTQMSERRFLRLVNELSKLKDREESQELLKELLQQGISVLQEGSDQYTAAIAEVRSSASKALRKATGHREPPE